MFIIKLYFKFINTELEYYPVINLQVKKYSKTKKTLMNIFIVNGRKCQVCTNGPSCCCIDVKNLKLKRKPGTSPGRPKPTLSINRKRKPEIFSLCEEVPNKVTIIES